MKTITLTEDEWHALLWSYRSLRKWYEAPDYKNRVDVGVIHSEFLDDMEQIVERLEKTND